MKTDLFQSCGHCWVFQICWHIVCSTFMASSSRIWNSSTGIPLPPLALFMEKAMAPTPVLLPGKSYGRRSLVDCHPWGRWELDRTEQLPFHFSLSCIGGGNGNPLQCSCLENLRDRGAWWAAVRVRHDWSDLAAAALFIVMLSKAHLTSHSRMPGSRSVIKPSWLSGSWRSFFYSASVYTCHLFLIYSASVMSIPFLSFIEPIFAWNVPLVSLIFLKRSLVFPIPL